MYSKWWCQQQQQPQPGDPVKDTVLVTCPVPGRPRHVEEHQLSLWGLFEDDLIELECRVHTPHVELVPGSKTKQRRGGGVQTATRVDKDEKKKTKKNKKKKQAHPGKTEQRNNNNKKKKNRRKTSNQSSFWFGVTLNASLTWQDVFIHTQVSPMVICSTWPPGWEWDVNGLKEVERNFNTHRFSHSLQHGKEKDTPLSALSCERVPFFFFLYAGGEMNRIFRTRGRT